MNVNDILELLAENPAAPLDVAETALYLARDEYPDLDVEAYLGELNAMGHEARSYLRGSLEARVHGLCRYLFHEMGFRGNTGHYYDPLNSYLNAVLDRRTGIPITLTAVAMAVGNRAGLEVYGVGLPGHFIAKAVGDGEEVLFDPFHGGRLLTVPDCELLASQSIGAPYQVKPAHLEALPLGLMLLRMLTNLKGVYLRNEDFARATRIIDRMRQLDPDDPCHARDLGTCLLRTGHPGKAIDHLQAYLAAVPQAKDRDAVRARLHQARGQIAQWN